MVEEPMPKDVVVREIKTANQVTSLFYPNTEDVMIVKKSNEGTVFTPVADEKVSTFEI
jgi:hypothetical protein